MEKRASLDAHVTDSALKYLLGCRGKFSTLEYLEIGIDAFGGRPCKRNSKYV